MRPPARSVRSTSAMCRVEESLCDPKRRRATASACRALGVYGLRRSHALRWRVKAVTNIADGADELLVLGPELGAQATHVHVNGARAAVVVKAPDFLQQLVTRVDAAGVLHEVLEELEL